MLDAGSSTFTPYDLSWDNAYKEIIGKTPPEDSLELRNSFIEGVLSDIDGKSVSQHEIHKEIQVLYFGGRRQGSGMVL